MSTAFPRLCAVLWISIGCVSCGTQDIDVNFYVYDGYTFSEGEQETVETIARDAMRDARRLLPGLPDRIIVRVNPGKKVMPETGQTGSVSLPKVVYWMVDPSRYGGVTAIAKRQLRSTTDWMSRHPDGRRWFGYKVGTYLVDQAKRASGRSSAELVSVPTDEILAMALKGSPN